MSTSLSGGIRVALWCTLALTALAQHVPDDKTAPGKSDAILCGIAVHKTTIRQAIQQLGRPTIITDEPSAAREGGGRSYFWKIGSERLELFTWNDHGNESIPYSVEVWGTAPDRSIGKTGMGLRLGDTLLDLRRIYGDRFEKKTLVNDTVMVTVQWQDETTLYVYFNNHGQINHLHLLAATE